MIFLWIRCYVRRANMLLYYVLDFSKAHFSTKFMMTAWPFACFVVIFKLVVCYSNGDMLFLSFWLAAKFQKAICFQAQNLSANLYNQMAISFCILVVNSKLRYLLVYLVFREIFVFLLCWKIMHKLKSLRLLAIYRIFFLKLINITD